jgi:ABC-2 type transport system ATP-binding protein
VNGGGCVVVDDLFKWFGRREAVSGLCLRAEPGRVTALLGPNGSGKTTTLRAILGLVAPDHGAARVDGVPYTRLGSPGRVVGAVLTPPGMHPGRSGRNHLWVYAAALGVPDVRVREVLGTVGLREAAGRRVGGWSLGMRQRLALATALLGDPRVLVLDEPATGLDPGGIAWLRAFLRAFARRGGTVLLSSHQLGEVERGADDVVVVRAGKDVYQGAVDDLRRAAGAATVVGCSDPAVLASALAAAGFGPLDTLPDGRLRVDGGGAAQVGEVALAVGVAVHGLVEETADLEQAFLRMTAGGRGEGGSHPAARAARRAAPARDDAAVVGVAPRGGGAGRADERAGAAAGGGGRGRRQHLPRWRPSSRPGPSATTATSAEPRGRSAPRRGRSGVFDVRAYREDGARRARGPPARRAACGAGRRGVSGRPGRARRAAGSR